jgi:hypothetical protein
MNQQEESREVQLPTAIRLTIFFWMVLVIFVYLLLFGPPEFWSISDRLGFRIIFKDIHNWLVPLLSAGYLE